MVGTLHSRAHFLLDRMGMEMTFTGESKITGSFNPDAGSCSDIEIVLDLQRSSLAELNSRYVVEPRRQSISGLLLAMFGTHKTPMGLLHPEPARAFGSFPLRDIEFGEFIGVCEKGEPRFRWKTS